MGLEENYRRLAYDIFLINHTSPLLTPEEVLQSLRGHPIGRVIPPYYVYLSYPLKRASSIDPLFLLYWKWHEEQHLLQLNATLWQYVMFFKMLANDMVRVGLWMNHRKFKKDGDELIHTGLEFHKKSKKIAMLGDIITESWPTFCHVHQEGKKYFAKNLFSEVSRRSADFTEEEIEKYIESMYDYSKFSELIKIGAIEKKYETALEFSTELYNYCTCVDDIFHITMFGLNIDLSDIDWISMNSDVFSAEIDRKREEEPYKIDPYHRIKELLENSPLEDRLFTDYVRLKSSLENRDNMISFEKAVIRAFKNLPSTYRFHISYDHSPYTPACFWTEKYSRSPLFVHNLSTNLSFIFHSPTTIFLHPYGYQLFLGNLFESRLTLDEEKELLAIDLANYKILKEKGEEFNFYPHEVKCIKYALNHYKYYTPYPEWAEAYLENKL